MTGVSNIKHLPVSAFSVVDMLKSHHEDDDKVLDFTAYQQNLLTVQTNVYIKTVGVGGTTGGYYQPHEVIIYLPQSEIETMAIGVYVTPFGNIHTLQQQVEADGIYSVTALADIVDTLICSLCEHFDTF